MRQHARAICDSYSEVFFLKGPWVGLAILAVTLLNPNVAAAGMIASVAAYGFALLIHMDRTFLASGFYIYNPLLVGLSIGYLFKITPLTVFFVVTAGILTFVFTHMVHSVLWYYLRLPILSLPFVVISSVVYLASMRYSNLLVTALYPTAISTLDLHLPIGLSGLLKSMGAILFVPHELAGAALLVVIFAASRILFVLALLGYYTGTLITMMMVGSARQAFGDINAFNYIWISMALGGVFLIPSMKSYVLALIAVATSTLVLTSVEVFWATYGIPAFALPFNIVSLAFIYVLGITGFPMIARLIRDTPEDSLDDYLSTSLRFRGSERTLSLPFSGRWTVWQAFDGPWTHQGSWRHAYDFVLCDDEGKTYQNDGVRPEDYYAFRKPVLSPVRGRVVQVMNTLPDNPIGQVDRTTNWGNAVTIQDPRGFWVELSHFCQESIRVKEGEWVEKGVLLGLCGNSGHSPQPHIHCQVQEAEEAGSATLPFSFVSYVTGQRFHANDLPREKEVVEPLREDQALAIQMSFVLDRQYAYEVFRSGRKIDDLILTVKMAPHGTFSLDSGKGRLTFGRSEGTFYFHRIEGRDPYLEALFLALPRLPLAFREGMTWEDYIPVGTVRRGVRKAVTLFLSSFHHNLNKIRATCTYRDRRTIDGLVTSEFLGFRGETEVELDPRDGLRRVRLNNLELRLK